MAPPGLGVYVFSLDNLSMLSHGQAANKCWLRLQGLLYCHLGAASASVIPELLPLTLTLESLQAVGQRP